MAIITNQATLTYGSVVVNSNVTVGELMQVLSVTKTAVDTSYTVDDQISYAVSLVNSGAGALEGLTVTDDLGAYPGESGTLYPLTYEPNTVRYFVNGILQEPPTVTAAEPLTLTGITVPAGGSAVLLYETAVNSRAPRDADAQIVNTATVSGPGLSADVSAQETITAADEPILTITKAMDPIVVQENGPLTYTFTILNTGNAPVMAKTAAVVSDTFDPALQNVTVTLNGSALTLGTDYSYDAATGAFSTAPGVLTVDAATFQQDPVTGVWQVTPSAATLIVAGTL